MGPKLKIFIILSAISISRQSFSINKAEEERLSGFAEHYAEGKKIDKARADGERAFFEESEQWEALRRNEYSEFKKQKKAAEIADDGPEFKQDAKDKKQDAIQYEESRKEFQKLKANERAISRESKKLPSELQELQVYSDRPRYDYSKRPLFGARYKWQGALSGSASSGSNFGGYNSGSGGSNFPSPPSFDDGGYIPAPNLPDDSDFPPPPPPPGFGDDSLGGGFGSDMPPPPPPPPPNFQDF